jgi:vitamin B12 transporter
MKFCSKCFFAAFLVVLLGSAPLHADQNTEPAYKLGEVVVSAKDQGAETVATVRTVSARQIQDRGARNLAEALQLVPGVNVRLAVDGTPRIDIRGFRTRHVLLLLDGIPINSTLDGQFDPAVIPVENIAEIKVTTSGSSVLYGPGGNGGIINIISKKGTAGIRGTVTGEAGQADRYLGRFTLSGGTDKITAFASGSTFHRHAFRLSTDFTPTPEQAGGHRDNSDREDNNVFVNLSYAPDDKTTVGLTASYNKGNYGIPPVVNSDKNDPFSKNAKYERVNDLEGYYTQLAVEHHFDGPVSLRGWAYFNQLRTEDNRYDNANYDTQVQKGSLRSNDTTRIGGGNVQLGYDLKKAGTATLALMGENDSWEGEGFTVVQPNKNTPPAQVSFDEDKNVQIYTAALQYVVSPLDKLGLVLGYGEHFQQATGNYENDYSYLVGLHYDLFSGTRLKLSYERKIRFPSIQQLYDISSGNSDLKPERTLHYDVGVEQVLPANTWLSLDVFRIDAHDFIEKDNATDLYTNYQKYRFQGFEVVAENHYVPNLALRASYTYLDSENRSSGAQLDELQYRPRDTVMLEARYGFFFGLTADASLEYVGDQYYFDKTSTMKKKLNDYTVVNLKLAQDLFQKRLNVYVGAENLFDQNYEQSYGVPQAGRTLYAGAQYRF